MSRIPLTSSTNRCHPDTDSITHPIITLIGRNVIPHVWPFGPQNITASRLEKRLGYMRGCLHLTEIFSMGFVRADSSYQPVSSTTSACSGNHSEPQESWMEGRVVLLAIGCSLREGVITVFKMCFKHMEHHLVLSTWWSTAFLIWKIHLKQCTHHHYV